MGIIEKQATKNLIYSYIGAFLGFCVVMFSSHILDPDQNGLTRILVSLSVLLAQFSGLGFNTITVRLFPYFRNKENGHHGFLYYGILVTLVGFILCILFYFISKNYLIESNREKSKLFIEYTYYLLPLTFFTLFFNLFDNYLRACYSSVIGSYSKELIQRVAILVSLGAYYLNIINFPVFIFLYVTSVCFPTLILLFSIIKLKEWHIKPIKGFISKELRKDMIKLSLYSILAGGASVLIANIDIIMVNQTLGLSEAGVYGIAFYFGTIIIIPSRSLLRIAMSVVAEAFKKNDLREVDSIYKKSCNSQLAIGMLLFVGILTNINNIMHLLPPEYKGGEYVIIFISIGYLVDMATGINSVIMITSKYYKYDGLFMVFVLAMTIITNYLLIPIYGITGSAIATAITLTFYNLLRLIFIYLTFKMQPYDFNSVKLITIAMIAFCIGYYLPTINSLFLDLFIRSAIVGGSYILLMIKSNAAPELNSKIMVNVSRLINRK